MSKWDSSSSPKTLTSGYVSSLPCLIMSLPPRNHLKNNSSDSSRHILNSLLRLRLPMLNKISLLTPPFGSRMHSGLTFRTKPHKRPRHQKSVVAVDANARQGCASALPIVADVVRDVNVLNAHMKGIVP